MGLAQAQTVPALVIGDGGQKVALQDIVSIKFDAASLSVYKTDGSILTEPLQTLTIGTTDLQGIHQVLASGANGNYVVYDLQGRMVKQGVATAEQDVLVGLPHGTYVVRMEGGQSFTIRLEGPVSCNAGFRTSSVTRAVSSTSLQLSVPGIDPQIALSRVDSLAFSSDCSFLYLYAEGMGNAFKVEDLASVTFPELSPVVTIRYEGEDVDGVNPFYYDGVMIRNVGAGVTVANQALFQEVEYELSGTSQNGYFKIYSEYKWQATLRDVNLTNPQGPAINSQTGKKGTIKSPNGTVNYLADGAQYATSPEDQKACVFGEGQLIFNGKGTLNITSYAKHGICSDDYVSLDNGNINVLAAASDAVHAKDSVIVQAGVVTLAPSSDGIDSDGPIFIRKGENGIPVLNIITTGDGAKGIKTAKAFNMSNGDVTITQSGKSEVKDGDTSRVIGIKAASITITGGKVVINNTAQGGKAYSADSVQGEEFISVSGS